MLDLYIFQWLKNEHKKESNKIKKIRREIKKNTVHAATGRCLKNRYMLNRTVYLCSIPRTPNTYSILSFLLKHFFLTSDYYRSLNLYVELGNNFELMNNFSLLTEVYYNFQRKKCKKMCLSGRLSRLIM